MTLPLSSIFKRYTCRTTTPHSSLPSLLNSPLLRSLRQVHANQDLTRLPSLDNIHDVLPETNGRAYERQPLCIADTRDVVLR